MLYYRPVATDDPIIQGLKTERLSALYISHECGIGFIDAGLDS